MVLILFNSLVMSRSSSKVVFRYDDSGNRIERYEKSQKSSEVDLANEPGESKEIISDLFESIKVFPNPVIDQLTIELGISDFDTFEISLYSINGGLLRSASSANSSYEIDFSKYAPGNYILVLNVQDRKLQYKIVKH